MKVLVKSAVAALLALSICAPLFAEERPGFRQEALDQMLAPIALYPDSLLSQILMASTYPLEVVHAARWSRSHPQLTGEDAVRAAEPMDWDPSVKSLAAFPNILAMMDEHIEWTEQLGEAFLLQAPQVMDTVQTLRRRAAAAGHLQSDEQMRVDRHGEHILIAPASPHVVYVPYYDPRVVYGSWWWPAYPPFYWGPPPGYYVRAVWSPYFSWGHGIVISTGFFFGTFDWHRRHVTVVHVHRHVPASRQRAGFVTEPRRVVWRHDPGHRRGASYRQPALREAFGPARAPRAREARRPTAGFTSSSSRESTSAQRRATPRAPVTQSPAAQQARGIASARADGDRGFTRGNAPSRQEARPAPRARADRPSQPRREAGRPATATRPAPSTAPARRDASATPSASPNVRRSQPPTAGQRMTPRPAPVRPHNTAPRATSRHDAPARPAARSAAPASRATAGNPRGLESRRPPAARSEARPPR
jgi:hypothetical protein